LTIWRDEQTQWRRVCSGSSTACSMAVMASAMDGSSSVIVVVMGIAPPGTLMHGDAS